MPGYATPIAPSRGKILREVLPGASEQQAVALIGILYETQFVLAVETWNAATLSPTQRAVRLQPLEPQPAARLVSDLYGHDAEPLLTQFQQEWAQLKETVLVKELRAMISSHHSVASLELFSSAS